MTVCLLLNCATLLAALCGLSHGQLESVDMQAATELLGRTFEEIRTDGLGIDALQVRCIDDRVYDIQRV